MKKTVCVLSLLAATSSFAEIKIGIIGRDTSHAVGFTKIVNVEKNPVEAAK